MSTTATKKSVSANVEIAELVGKMFSFNSSLKLYHWHITGKGSYAKHIALDQAIESLLDVTDRLVETSYAVKGDLNITIPQTKVPSDIVKHAKDFFDVVQEGRELFPEAFTQAILDDYQEAIQQLLYRLIRLE